MSKGQIFIAPEGFQGGGLFVGGGWHNLVETTKGPGVVMPVGGDWGMLGAVGFVADPNAEVVPASVANDGFPDLPADPQ